MGYFPSLQPGGGSGFQYTSHSTAITSAAGFNGVLLTATIPADTKFIVIESWATRYRSSTGNIQHGIIQGYALLDTTTHDFKSSWGGCRNTSPQEPTGSENKNLLDNVPGQLIDALGHRLRITTYSGAGATLNISATEDDPVATLFSNAETSVKLLYIRRP